MAKLVSASSKTRQLLLLSISAALFLMVIKFITGLFTHSMSIMASALDSALDAAMSFVNLVAFHEASKPPDEEHAYGHGKIESLASLFQSLLILLSGSYVIYEAVKRLSLGSYVTVIPIGILVIVFSGGVTFLLAWKLRRMSRETKSLILRTETLHYTMDFVAYAGVLLALILVSITGWVIWDLVIAMVMVGYIFWEALKILKRAGGDLLDRGLSKKELAELRKLILNHHRSIVGVHNLRSRFSGNQLFLDFHIVIRGEGDFVRAHEMTESLIAKIKEQRPQSDITVHFDPEESEEHP